MHSDPSAAASNPSASSSTQTAAPPQSFASFAVAPAPDGLRVLALLFDAGGQALDGDVLDPAVSAERDALLDRFGTRATAAGLAFDRAAADRQLLAEAVNVAAAPLSGALAGRLDRLGITVVGTGPSGAVVLFSEGTGRTHVVPRVAKLEFEDLLQIVGPGRAGLAVRDRTRSSPPGAVTLREVKESLALNAAEVPALRDGGRGQGVWPLSGGNLLINDGALVYEYDGAAVADYAGHQADGRPILRGGSGWAGPELRAAVEAMTAARAAAAYGRLLGLTEKWAWATPGGAALAAALIVATFVQAVLGFRPRAAVVGATNTGKSTFVEKILKLLFGGPSDWAPLFDDATAAGVRQSVGNDSPPVALDEFENDEHRSAVMRLFRSASRGSRMVRGTPGQTAHSTELRLLAWVLCIEAGDLPAQDRNRQIVLALDTPPSGSSAPDLPSDDELFALRIELIAAAIWAVRAANELAGRVRQPCPPGVDRRLVESLAEPACFDAILRRGRDVDDAVARGTLERFVAASVDAEPADTGRDLLDAICRTAIRIDGGPQLTGGRYPVGELLLERTGATGFATGARGATIDRALEMNGLRVFKARGRTATAAAKPAGLFVTNAAGTTLLAGTDWDGADLKTVLLRLPDASDESQRVCGRPARGAFVPKDVLDLQGA